MNRSYRYIKYWIYTNAVKMKVQSPAARVGAVLAFVNAIVLLTLYLTLTLFFKWLPDIFSSSLVVGIICIAILVVHLIVYSGEGQYAALIEEFGAEPSASRRKKGLLVRLFLFGLPLSLLILETMLEFIV